MPTINFPITLEKSNFYMIYLNYVFPKMFEIFFNYLKNDNDYLPNEGKFYFGNIFN
jgi:hypothetical protein